jgi:hypothetical protein
MSKKISNFAAKKIVMPNKLSTPSPLRTGKYKKTTKHFFERSKLFDAQITDLFDGFWPIVTALKNLRWQVIGYHEMYNVPNNVDLRNKFVENNDVTNRPNLYRTFIDEDWNITEDRLVQNLLINLFACYEGWCEDITRILSIQRPKTLQSVSNDNFASFFAIHQILPHHTIATCYYNQFKSNCKLYNVALLNNWMKVYRYFKECRNAIVHNGGVVTQKVVDQYAIISAFTINDLGLKEIPETFPLVVGEKLKLSLRGVVGFSQIIRNLVANFDVEMIKFSKAEQYYLQILKTTFPVQYNTDPLRYKNQIQYISSQCHFGIVPKVHLNLLYRFLQQNNIMR